MAWPPAARKYLNEWERLSIIDGVLRRAWYNTRGNAVRQQLVTPRAIIRDVLTTCHDNQMAGHFGEKRTLLRTRDQFYWVGMAADVRDWYRSCDVCCARRAPPNRPHHSMEPQVVAEPLQRVALDILGPLDPPTTRGNRYVLVIVDYLTKFVEALPMANQTAEECAYQLVTQFVCRYGIPKQLHSDQGRQFESRLFQEMCRLLGINKTRTTALHPQGDGQAERQNRTLLDVVAKLAKDNPRDWDEYLPYAMAAFRSSVHRVTGETPNRLMFGREATTPATLLAPQAPDAEPRHEWVDGLHQRFRDTYRLVVEATQASQRVTQRYANRRQKNMAFKKGDLVWLYEPKPRKGRSPKLNAEKWTGPWTIEKVISACVYLIKWQNTQKTRIVNVDRLVPYVTRDNNRFPPENADDVNRQSDDEIDSDRDDVDNESQSADVRDVDRTSAASAQRYCHSRAMGATRDNMRIPQ